MAQNAMTEMRVSTVFETHPITHPESPENWNLPYYNLVVLGKTSFSPHELLTELKRIERLLGRDIEHSAAEKELLMNMVSTKSDEEVVLKTSEKVLDALGDFLSSFA